MKDRNGQTLYMGDKITISDNARPWTLVGRHGIVESWGDKRVKIRLMIIRGVDLEEQFIRIDPQMVIRGSHIVISPGMEKAFELIMYVTSSILEKSVKENIISEKQKKLLLKRYKEEFTGY